MNEEEIWKDFEFIEPTNKFLKLKSEIMENIFRQLDRRDSYEACLIHPNWSIAAVKILWEAPRFDNATQFKRFMNTICQIKRLALLVRDVSLAFLNPGPDYFLPHHLAESTKMVAHPRFLGPLVQQCEQINRLTCYGWQLDCVEWERLSILVQNVVHLHVIGENELNINTFLSRLVSLRIDDCSRLDQIFVANLVHRATQLQELDLSLKHTDLRALITISSEGQMNKMRSMTLTGADDFEAGNLNDFLKAFPNLTRFRLCGSVKMSLTIISVTLKHWPTFQSLEIRGYPKRDSTTLDCSVSKLTHLAIQGLDLTESSPQTLVSALPRLEQIRLSHCQDIYSGSLHLLRSSIQRISIESCGRMFPSDVYQLCVQLPRLHQLVFIGYPDLMDSVINTYSSSRLSHVIELESRAIQSLVEGTPMSRSLTTLQIHWIAQQLNLTPQAFSNLLSASEKLDLESSVNESTDNDSTSAIFWSDSTENEDILSQKKEVSWKPNEESPITHWKPKEEELPTVHWKPKEEMMFDNEGWGEPKKVVDWLDLRTQGFAHELIKEQEKTKFYCQ